MLIGRLFCCLAFLSLLSLVQAQTSDRFDMGFIEGVSERHKFQMYLDTSAKYLYENTDIALQTYEECQNLIIKNISLSDSVLFNYYIHSIYVKHSIAKPLEAYEVLLETGRLRDSIEISYLQECNYKYIKSFTFMSIGDIESAQKSYYDNMAFAEENNDTLSRMSNLFSLGQLYNDEEDFETAIKCFNELIVFEKAWESRPYNLVLCYLGLGDSYMSLKNYGKALKSYDRAKQISENNNLKIILSDTEIRRGHLYLETNKIDSALLINKRLLKANEASRDNVGLFNLQMFQAQLYKKQKLYYQELSVYKQMLLGLDSVDVNRLIEVYENAQVVNYEIGNYKDAYMYFQNYTDVKERRDAERTKQLTSSFKVKYESDKKEQENRILNSEIAQNATKRKFLTACLVFSFLVLTLLIGAFFQSKRYSKKLEMEVENRTLNLKESNKLLDKSNIELKEFNRILSHDLKEPLRSIIGFSQLASRRVGDNSEVTECLDFVISGGRQLEKLIEGINDFQTASAFRVGEVSKIEIKNLVESSILKLKDEYPDKRVKLNFDSEVFVYSSREVLKSVFTIVFDNAIKFNNNKVVHIDLKYKHNNQLHQFEVVDNGIGVSKKYQDHIFQMFKRLNERRKFEGSGMGLSIATKLIGSVKGEISLLKSEELKGSSFMISFPNLKLS